MLSIEAYTDGACSGNPGIGGWGVVLLAKKNGLHPGNNIFIHGGPKNFLKHLLFDWTEGCIALTDSEMNEIYDIVPVNTPIYITS